MQPSLMDDDSKIWPLPRANSPVILWSYHERLWLPSCASNTRFESER